MWIFWIITHVTEEQRGDNVGGRTAGGGMPTARGGGCVDRMNPQLIGNALQTFNVNIVHEFANIGGNCEKESRSYWLLGGAGRAWPGTEQVGSVPALITV